MWSRLASTAIYKLVIRFSAQVSSLAIPAAENIERGVFRRYALELAVMVSELDPLFSSVSTDPSVLPWRS